MNSNQLMRMFTRLIMRRAMAKGLNAGINAASGAMGGGKRKRGGAQMNPPAQRQVSDQPEAYDEWPEHDIPMQPAPTQDASGDRPLTKEERAARRRVRKQRRAARETRRAAKATGPSDPS